MDRLNGFFSKPFFKLLLLSIVTIAMVVSCAPPEVKRKKIKLVWPLPPDEPKIEFVDIIRSTLDIGQKKGISEALFGEEDVYNFQKPYGVTVGPDEKIYVTDIGRVIVMDLKNKEYDFIGLGPGMGELGLPIGIAITSDNRLFVGDVAQNKVFVYVNGRFSTALGHEGEFDSPSGIAVDEKHNKLYIVDAKKHRISVYELTTYKPIKTIGHRGTGPGEFNFPTNIAVDEEGNLYVVDTGNFRVQILSPEGKHIRTIGKLGDVAGSFARPKGIGIDSEGHIYVADAAFQNFQIFDKDGKILLYVGSSGIGPGKFSLPAGLYVDRNTDKIYVVNQIPGDLQIFQYLGKKWKQRQQAGENSSAE